MTQESELSRALTECRQDEVKALVREQIDSGIPAAEIVAQCNRGMIELGDRFGRGECFLPELMVSGMIMKGVMADLEPLLDASEPTDDAGKVVMGSVQYDVHDIGKDIVVMMLRGVGFDVVDLGVDVPPEKFVAAVREHQPQTVGLSILLTTCFKSVAATVAAIKSAGLRDQVSIMVGGAAASDLLSENAGCDFYGKSAVDALRHATARRDAAG